MTEAKPQTRAQQLAEAYLAIARTNHYMVGIADPDGTITDEEISDAEQILINLENRYAAGKDESLTTQQAADEHNACALALDLIEQEKRDRLVRDSQAVQQRYREIQPRS